MTISTKYGGKTGRFGGDHAPGVAPTGHLGAGSLSGMPSIRGKPTGTIPRGGLNKEQPEIDSDEGRPDTIDKE